MLEAPPQSLRLLYRLHALPRAGTVLQVGAHPDDEDSGVVAWLARKQHVRTIYWSATRGEGGQNKIGPYRGAALGLFRTWESLRAREIDGGECLYGPFVDFGYSKTHSDTLEKWGHEALLREMVRAVRIAQPQVVISRWKGNDPASDQHGHHQAVGYVATQELWTALREPNRFPELDAVGLPRWLPRKLYVSTNGDFNPGQDAAWGIRVPEFEAAGYLRIDTGGLDPLFGHTYQEIGLRAINCHQSQGVGFVPTKGGFSYYYKLLEGPRAAGGEGESGFHNGLDPLLTGLAQYPGEGIAGLAESLREVQDAMFSALATFRWDSPAAAGRDLMAALSTLRALCRDLEPETRDNPAIAALWRALGGKEAETVAATAECLGLCLDAVADRPRVTPGKRIRIESRLHSAFEVEVADARFSIERPKGYEEEQSPSEDGLGAVHQVTVAQVAELDSPYWLREPPGRFRYDWPEGEPAGRALGPPALQARCDVRVDGHPLTLRAPVEVPEAFEGGYRALRVATIPPISLHPRAQRVFWRCKSEAQHVQLQVVARRNTDSEDARGTLRLAVPEGWYVRPDEQELRFDPGEESQTRSFLVEVPADAEPGRYDLKFSVEVEGRVYDVLLDPVRMATPGIPRPPDETNALREEFITSPSSVDLRLIDVHFASDLRYAYVRGVDEEIPQSLEALGLTLRELDDEELGFADLDSFDTLVVGPNAFLSRPALVQALPRLDDYVRAGGTIVVQYQGYHFEHIEAAPYPFSYSQPHDRVTDEFAEVSILEPDHSLFHLPNHIGPEDFEGWVHDRGMYFFGDWDSRYKPLLSCHDRDEEPKKGGLLIANHGRGSWVYAAYSFHRQIPEGVAGGFRLFANLLAIPLARILERARILGELEIFSSLSEEQRQSLARLMRATSWSAGAQLARQGDPSDEMFVIVDGEVDIIDEDSGTVVYTSTVGQAIGELGVIGEMPRSKTMRAKTDVRALVIRGGDFKELLMHQPQLAYDFVQMLVRKLADQ